jgi:hypothetical protein
MKDREAQKMFLEAMEWAEKENFEENEGNRFGGFCRAIDIYLCDEINLRWTEIIKIRTEIMQNRSISKHKPILKYTLLFWFEPKEWAERKIIIEKIRKEYQENEK